MNCFSFASNDAQACQLYLSGDLTPAQAAAFDQRLGQSPELASELLAQSELICQVSALSMTEQSRTEQSKTEKDLSTAELVSTAVSAPVFKKSQDNDFTNPGRQSRSSLSWVSALLAIAACLALMTTWWINRPEGSSVEVATTDLPQVDLAHEDQLIALAWASTDTNVQFFDADSSEFEFDGVELSDMELSDMELNDMDLGTESEFGGDVITETSSDRSSLSWVSAAIESGASVDG